MQLNTPNNLEHDFDGNVFREEARIVLRKRANELERDGIVVSPLWLTSFQAKKCHVGLRPNQTATHLSIGTDGVFNSGQFTTQIAPRKLNQATIPLGHPNFDPSTTFCLTRDAVEVAITPSGRNPTFAHDLNGRVFRDEVQHILTLRAQELMKHGQHVSPLWITFEQAKSLKTSIRKRETGTHLAVGIECVFNAGQCRTVPKLLSYPVFKTLLGHPNFDSRLPFIRGFPRHCREKCQIVITVVPCVELSVDPTEQHQPTRQTRRTQQPRQPRQTQKIQHPCETHGTHAHHQSHLPAYTGVQTRSQTRKESEDRKVTVRRLK